MKNRIIILLILAVVLTSCSIENDYPSFYTETIPIESVNMPQEFVFGDTYEIEITYNRPTTCYLFNNFFYDVVENERTIAVINTVYTNTTCTATDESVSINFTLSITSTETYVFKFFQGKDENGEDQYYIVEVPVVE